MDLLENLTDDTKANQVVDLLDSLDEGGAPAWIAREAGDGVQGTVVSISSTKGKFVDAESGQLPDCPVITLRKADGGEVRVTGFQSILRKEINEAGVQVGDLFAAKYFGKKTGKSGTEYHHYKVAVRPGPRTAPVPAQGRPF